MACVKLETFLGEVRMDGFRITVENEPRSEDVLVLSQGLSAHSLPHTEVPGFQPIAVFLRDEQDRIVGGVWGYVNWNWLFLGLVWLSDSLRGRGCGRELIEKIENEALARGCQFSHLDTFSYQARPFYEKLGYEVFAVLDNYPPGHQRFFMKKTLGRRQSEVSF